MKKIFEKMYKTAYKTVVKNKDLISEQRSVVCSIVATPEGKIYSGVNVPWWHSVCAEPVAVGSGRADEARKFEYCISVKMHKITNEIKVVAPCGICRQMFAEMYPDIKIILGEYPNLTEHTITELLPY